MPDLANTLRMVVEAEQAALAAGETRSEALRAAFDRFYRGDIAEEMARFYRENGGDFTMEDFARYEPIWAEPLHTTYRGYDVYTSPPTSRGGLEVTMQLNLVEGFDLRALGPGSAETLHLLSEAIKVAKADVYAYAADPALVDVPLDELLSKDYAAARRSLIDPSRVMTYPGAGNPVRVDDGQSDPRAAAEPAPEWRRGHLAEQAYAGSTTSFSIADQFGNVVAATPTHGGAFGTGVVVGNTGLTFNNGSRVGSTSPYPDHVNYVRGGQIPILNNSPIIVLRGRAVPRRAGHAGRRDDRPDAVSGSREPPRLRDADPGGDRGPPLRPKRGAELLPARRRGPVRPRGSTTRRRRPHASDVGLHGGACARIRLRQHPGHHPRRRHRGAHGRRRPPAASPTP